MEINNFRDLYLAELQELHNVKQQLAEEHRRIADAATHRALKEAVLRHRQETLSQKAQLEDLLRQHGADPQEHRDQAMEAIVHETEKMMSIVAGDDLRDAAFIASAQKIAHYEIAAFGTAAALAGQLGFRKDQQILHNCLEEEKRADAALTHLAKGKINKAAAAA
jgi:ferritin-like metal-binding protein YciE